jgi:hypothetical protein
MDTDRPSCIELHVHAKVQCDRLQPTAADGYVAAQHGALLALGVTQQRGGGMRRSAARRKGAHAVHARDNDGISMCSGMSRHGIPPGCLEQLEKELCL